MKRLWKIFKAGIIYENPLLMLMIGLCSALAVTTNVSNGVGMMGVAMTNKVPMVFHLHAARGPLGSSR